jgi:predicted nucleic acid-binding protein
MVLVDTAVWIDHLHVGLPELVALLEQARVCTHPMVIGELALGNLSRRDEVITLLSDLSGTTTATNDEVLQLIDSQQLSGKGLSLVDVHLLAATLLTPDTVLWTSDKHLRAAAAAAGVAMA